MYLGGDEIIAIDRKTQRLAWATKVPIATDYARPIMTANRLYQFTPRGVFEIDKVTGENRQASSRQRSLESRLGRTLRIKGSTLVSVSNLAVTAYALSGEQATPAPKKVAGQ